MATINETRKSRRASNPEDWEAIQHDKKEEEDAVAAEAMMGSASPPAGTCAVDIRVFLLTITIAMSASFFAGIAIHLPLDRYFQQGALMMGVVSPLATSSSLSIDGSGDAVVPPETSRLELSPADLSTAGSHSPSGQHLLVDMIGIEAAFLDSEERLADAMVRTVHEAGLTMLSYHCHKLDPAGISCVGVLLESHIR